MPASKTKRTRVTLTLDASTEPPKEFRVFRRGINATSKGDFLFDDDAAKQVMSAYRQAGVDVMIDLEHLSLDKESESYDPNAYGWCKLELRNGELWAVNVAWTSEGAERLRSKKSRYISPAFHFLTDNGRITEIYNIAICAVPATYETPALVAASKRVGKQIGTLTIEVQKMDVKKILAALGLGEDATLEDVLDAIKTLQDDGGEQAADDPKDPKDEDEEEAADDPAAGDDAAMAAAISDLPPKVQAKILAATSGKNALEERLAKLEKDNKRTVVEALIAANASKLPKGLEAWARKQDAETLSEYFKNATPVDKPARIPPQRKGAKPASTSGEEEDEVSLSKADLLLMRQTGKTREQMLKLKKDRVQKDRARKQEIGFDDDSEDAEAVA